MSDLISMDKEYRTRNGDAVEVLKIGINHDKYPVAVVVTMDDGSQILRSRTSTGRVVCGVQSEGDLIEVKPRIKKNLRVNIYSDGAFACHPNKEIADSQAVDNRIACVKVEIDCEHGEGL